MLTRSQKLRGGASFFSVDPKRSFPMTKPSAFADYETKGCVGGDIAESFWSPMDVSSLLLTPTPSSSFLARARSGSCSSGAGRSLHTLPPYSPPPININKVIPFDQFESDVDEATRNEDNGTSYGAGILTAMMCNLPRAGQESQAGIVTEDAAGLVPTGFDVIREDELAEKRAQQEREALLNSTPPRKLFSQPPALVSPPSLSGEQDFYSGQPFFRTVSTSSSDFFGPESGATATHSRTPIPSSESMVMGSRFPPQYYGMPASPSLTGGRAVPVTPPPPPDLEQRASSSSMFKFQPYRSHHDTVGTHNDWLSHPGFSSQFSDTFGQGQAGERQFDVEPLPLATPAVQPSPPRDLTLMKKREAISGSSFVEKAKKLKEDRQQDRKRLIRDYQKDSWYHRLADARDFAEKHKHCHIPHSYKPNMALARWAKRQRYQWKLYHKEGPEKSSLTLERLADLEELNFVFDIQDNIWQGRYELLTELTNACTCKKTGLVNGAKFLSMIKKRGAKGHKLLTWIKCQRRMYKLRQDGRKSSMTDDRIARLDAIGFPFVMGHPRAGQVGQIKPSKPITKKTQARCGKKAISQAVKKNKTKTKQRFVPYRAAAMVDV